MNFYTAQKKSAHLRLVKSGVEIDELEAWEKRDAMQKHEDLKREALASRNTNIFNFTLVDSAGPAKGTLH